VGLVTSAIAGAAHPPGRHPTLTVYLHPLSRL